MFLTSRSLAFIVAILYHLLPRGLMMRVLTGWKQIATHMKQSIRTVQRWELVGLPVHRPKLEHSKAVVAFAEELDAWMEAAPVRLDIIRDLHDKVASLEEEIVWLKQQLVHKRILDGEDALRENAQAMKRRASELIASTREQRRKAQQRIKTL